MKLTKDLLNKWGACKEGINFCERNKLFGFDLNRIDEIKGEHNCFVDWIKSQLTFKREYDSKGNQIKKEHSNGYWVKLEYDANGNCIKQESSNGYWWKWEYDTHGNCIKEENSNGKWFKLEYDSQGNQIKEENSNGCVYTIKTEYYPNGQLKRIGNLELPLIY